MAYNLPLTGTGVGWTTLLVPDAHYYVGFGRRRNILQKTLLLTIAQDKGERTETSN